jgi:magnesium transporter
MGERRTRVWRDGELVARGVPEDELADHLRTNDALVWIDLCGPTSEELGVVATLLDLDPLAVEDALATHERTKIDHYSDYYFLQTYQASLNVERGTLETVGLSVFVTQRALVTVRPGPGLDLKDLAARWKAVADIRRFGVFYLLYALLDLVVDGHFEAVQALDTEIESLEDQLFAPKSDDAAVQRRSFQLRKSLVLLRRIVLPMRELVNALIRRELGIVPDGMTPYYHDVYDHILRATDWTDSLRDLVTTLLDTRIALQDNRLNQVMKKITAVAALIAVPTAVTGFYGMNVPYPGFGSHIGFLISIAIMLVLAITLFIVFRRRDWL